MILKQNYQVGYKLYFYYNRQKIGIPDKHLNLLRKVEFLIEICLHHI